MTWSSFYLICFVVGFGLSALSFVFGHLHLHLPHLHFHDGVHLGHGAGHGGHGHAGHNHGAPWFNLGTVAAFLAWFGGTGYLLMQYYSVWFGLALVISTVSGLGGASIVFLFLAKILLRHERTLDSADYEMIGVLGRLSSPIRGGGTGEIIYTQAGTRRVAGARAESGTAIPKGTEVVVTRYEKGIAYVRAWDELTGEMDTSFRS
jgi:membrane protein implicated in regulation of membrane protease activity